MIWQEAQSQVDSIVLMDSCKIVSVFGASDKFSLGFAIEPTESV